MSSDDGQRKAAWVATITALIVVASFVAGKAARDAILLSSFDIETFPLFIGISAVLSLPLNLISAVFAIVEWFLLAKYPRPATVVIYFHLSTSGAVMVSGFWSIINERF